MELKKKTKFLTDFLLSPHFFGAASAQLKQKKFSLAKKTTHAYFFFSDNSEILPSALEAFNP